ncbi:type II toxin-antitoxin system RelE/ParE family toxin [Chloroflexota bacterium]
MWEIEYYQTQKGRFPAAEFIDSLDVKSKAKIARTLDLLEQFGIELGMPYAKYLEEQLWELRTRYGKNRYRILYFLASGQAFVLLHGLTKKSGPIPRKDIEIAKTRRSDYLSRKG